MSTDGAHRVEICEGWSAWSWVLLRGAGFPAAGVLRLAAPESAAAADELIERRRETEQARQRAIEALGRLFEPLEGAARNRVRTLLRRLRRGGAPPADCPEPAAAAAGELESLREAEARRDEATRRLDDQLAADDEQIERALRDVAGDDRFREALAWQNRSGLHTAADRLVEQKTARRRRHQHMVASYFQRYSTKNDIIGFFGPLSWGRLVAEPGAARAKPGPELVDRRAVQFEYWAIEALARQLADDPELVVQLAPRLTPAYRLEDRSVVHWLHGETALPPAIAALLRLVDGETPARDLAGRLADDEASPFESADEIYAVLEQLAERGLLIWTIEIPMFVPRPEQALRGLLEPLEGAARDRGLAALDELETARAAVATGAGDPARVDSSLGALEDTFSRLTDTAATRRAGRMYAARTIACEDCFRDLSLDLGPELFSGIDRALAIVLHSARWFTYRIAERFEAEIERIFSELGGESGATVSFGELFSRVEPLFPGEFAQGGSLVEQVVDELQARWAELLELDHAAARIDRDSRDVDRAAADRFTAPHPGWASVQHLSPDLLFAASSFDEVTRGGGLAVLGELHPSNSLVHQVDLSAHPDPDAVVAAYEAELPWPRLQPLMPRRLVHRAYMTSPSSRDFDLLTDDAPSRRPRDHQLAVSDLVVTRNGAKLVVRSRNREISFGILNVFDSHLTNAAISQFKLLGSADHVPRVTLDRLVLAREQWRFAPDDVDFARLRRGSEQFAAARAFAARHRLPRWVFLKVPEEMKPVFVDFASPISVEIAARQVDKASSVAVSEMLPSVEQTWLPDAAGNTYTCELRMAMLDPNPWQPPRGES